MKAKTILLVAGGLVFAAAVAVAALLLPVREASEPAQAAQAQPSSEPAKTEPIKEEAVMEETTPEAVEPASQMPTEQTTSTVVFPSGDGLAITADLYWSGDASAPFIVLFHQADYSRGEYLEIAPKLVTLGYNCLAVDQRSGGAANGVRNETYQAAKAAKLPSEYTDAYSDLEAALSYAIETYAPKRLIVWGSSYSSSLSLILASKHPDEIDAVLAFSPGEYFKLEGQSVADYAKDITQPAFITSAKSEEKGWRGIADAIPSAGSVFFVPQENGRHGSSALFENTPNHAEYWTATEAFLASLR